MKTHIKKNGTYNSWCGVYVGWGGPTFAKLPTTISQKNAEKNTDRVTCESCKRLFFANKKGHSFIKRMTSEELKQLVFAGLDGLSKETRKKYTNQVVKTIINK